MLARPLVHNAPFPATYSSLTLAGDFATPTYVGATYDDSLIISGGSGTYGSSSIVSGALPGGLSLSVVGAELKITGTPTTPGTFHFIARVKDTVNGWYSFIEASILVYAALVITGTFTGHGVLLDPYSSDIDITGGDGVYSNPQVASGAKPDDLNLSIVGDKIRLSGTQTISDIYDFTVSCDSGDGQTATSDPQEVDFT